MFQATRRRLALWYAAVTAVLLLLFATGMYFYVRHTLIERVDDTLNHVVEVVRRSSFGQAMYDAQASPTPTFPIETPTEISSLHHPFTSSFSPSSPLSPSTTDDRIDLEWFDATGTLRWSTRPDPFALPLHLNPNGETVRQGEEIWRQIAVPIAIGDRTLGYLRASHPWFEVTKPSLRLAIELCFWIVLMVAGVGAIGWFLSGLAISPVRQSYQNLKQFVGDASHELRNPIATIQTNAQVALADTEAAGHRQHLETIEKISRRLGRLVDDLLFLARQDSGVVRFSWKAVDLDALLLEVVEEQRIWHDLKTAGVRLSLEIAEPEIGALPEAELEIPEADDRPFAVWGDRDRFARLFENLLGNAIRYSLPARSGKTEGRVTVSLSAIAANPTNAKASAKNNSRIVRVVVEDNGIGIASEDLPHIFDRFYRADGDRNKNSVDGGSGLGLAIARAIVRDHRGEIHATSQLDRGTCITVAFPAVLASMASMDS